MEPLKTYCGPCFRVNWELYEINNYGYCEVCKQAHTVAKHTYAEPTADEIQERLNHGT